MLPVFQRRDRRHVNLTRFLTILFKTESVKGQVYICVVKSHTTRWQNVNCMREAAKQVSLAGWLAGSIFFWLLSYMICL